MFDIGATELLLVAMVALVVIGPKDLPLAMRTAGRWIGQLRKMTGHFRVGIDAMIREAEVDEQEKIWAEKNAKIMREHPSVDDGERGNSEQGDDRHVEGMAVSETPRTENSAEPPPAPDDEPENKS
ncbi:Sec-independent protein translocase protein TatB [Parasphingopyxis marina]|uniref:Sec-independent protein translocase protein TatB n=1 Tax=Parasphingopyxis marina TaxID=2761622 RepID=A0A842HX34_9SPHN|nr:Sec-independent protein translocase protein TatB [Parasphingopyxis marina]MBC2776977.1 twin-arginine translocase subunit TatB [Parasphingopyxis marina]